MGLLSGIVKFSLLKRVFNAVMRRRGAGHGTAARGRRPYRRGRRTI